MPMGRSLYDHAKEYSKTNFLYKIAAENVIDLNAGVSLEDFILALLIHVMIMRKRLYPTRF